MSKKEKIKRVVNMYIPEIVCTDNVMLPLTESKKDLIKALNKLFIKLLPEKK